jgi:hypothetical protein
MPTLYGGAFVGIRSDRAAGLYADKDGNLLTPAGPGSLVNTPVVLHEYVLGVRANIPGGATIDAALTSNNYKNYLGTLGQTVGLNTNPAGDTYIHHLEVDTPFNGIGRGSKFTIGRYAEKLGHLTLWKPDVDTYFNNPFEDNGNFYIDGARLRANFGSVNVEAFGGKFSSNQGANGFPVNSPLAGASSMAIFGGPTAAGITFKPIAQANQGQMTVDEAAGISGGFGFKLFDRPGHIRLTALALANTGATPPGAGFTNVLVLGADSDIGIAERLGLTLDYAQSVIGTGSFNTVAPTPHENNAFNATLGYGSGGLNITAGYRYIDPLFYAPGYWGRIGNWLNPTNIQGPTFRAAYDFSPSFGMNIGGDWFIPAHNRGANGSLDRDEEITRALVGVRWGLTKGFNITADYEGVYWALANARGGGGGGQFHPTEQYITFGTGYNLTANTLLKLAYQIGDFNGHGGLGAGTLAGGSTHYNFNTFTGQVAVKF